MTQSVPVDCQLAPDRKPPAFVRKFVLLAAAIAAAITLIIVAPPSAAFGADYYCAGMPATIVGTDGPNSIFATDGPDVIVGLGGDDRIFGKGGDDVICGNGGNDSIYAGDGDDVIYGGWGDDLVYGENGADVIHGNSGMDELRGGSGNDKLYGGDDDDLLIGDGHDDTMFGGNGNDELRGGPDDDRLYGGEGNDFLQGAEGNDYLRGEGGHDIAKGGGGDDVIYGDEGNDYLRGETGNDYIGGDSGDDKLYGDDGNDRLFGGDGADLLEGGSNRDFMNGGPGPDRVEPGDGADTIDWFHPETDTLGYLHPEDTVNMNWLAIPLSASPGEMSVAIPIFGYSTLFQVRTTLRPQIRPGDTFIITSGNTVGVVDVGWVNAAAGALSREFPSNRVVVLTSGLDNISAAAAGVDPTVVDAILYDYEPNFPNEPEFTWDFAPTMTNIEAFASTARAAGIEAGAYLTGRPVLQKRKWDSGWGSYGWDFGAIQDATDDLFVQTQTYCTDGIERFEKALDEVQGQTAGNWFAQVTIVEHLYNGATVAQSQACADAVVSRGIHGMVVWWSSMEVEVMTSYLAYLGR